MDQHSVLHSASFTIDANINNGVEGQELVCSIANTNQISSLKRRSESLHQLIQAFHIDFENFRHNFHEFNITKLKLSPDQLEQVELNMRAELQQLNSRKSMQIQELRSLIFDYDQAQNQVINELQIWKHNVALFGNGQNFENNLNDIQKCFESLIEIICSVIGMGRIMDSTESSNAISNDLMQLMLHARYQQQVLILSAFIVEKQPPQVLKTHTKFKTTVRWLIGHQLGIHMHNIQVKCVILSEDQAKLQFRQRIGDHYSSSLEPPSSGIIENNVANMEYQGNNRHFGAQFRNISLRKINRPEKRATTSVMDEKFALLFYTSCFIDDYRIHAWTLSLPIVVIVHNNQESNSWATITWDNAFSDLQREPFQVPVQVSWCQLSCALNRKFTADTGRPLTKDNIDFIYHKFFPNSSSINDHDSITWMQLCKQPMQDRTFTFWDWFYAIVKLIKDNFKALWQKDLVVGFIDKQKTMEILGLKSQGTFMLRFSDSKLGSISVALKHGNRVLMLDPWSPRDLHARGLVERIFDLQVLGNILPKDIDKKLAFSELPQPTNDSVQQSNDGYVRSTLRACAPDVNELASQQAHSLPTDDPNQEANVSSTTDSDGSCILEDFIEYFNAFVNDDMNCNHHPLSQHH